MVVSFHALAEGELNDGAQYYEQQQTGLGDAFLTEIRRCTREITEHPNAGPVVLAEVRRRLCHRFPYALLYTIRPDTLRILAVMNLRRRPAYWVGRH